MKEKTLTIIKPNAIQHSAAIWAIIKNAGFGILTVKRVQLTLKQAEKFYIHLKDYPFYKNLTEFMASGECMIAILEKENAINDFRELIGATHPDQAKKGTIRQLYGNPKLIYPNAIHGSDSVENAELEIRMLYPEYDDL